jgi:membrane-associated protease RseP (regulator of RpoE activity)
MRRWPFQSSEQAPLEHFPIIEDLLRRNIEDIFRVERQEARGVTFGWGGTLLVEPARALALIEPRFKSFGYTPFLGRQGDLVWIRAVPLAEVSERTKAGVNLILFALTLLSTLAAGSLVSGSFPFVTFNPSLEPFRLLDGVPFAFTLLAILGTHEFGHYFTARYHGASVSLPYFIPAPPPIFLFGTMGAVIRMRSPARDRNSLFDIAVAGPLAGLVVAVPALLLGLSWSRVGMVLPDHSGLTFGDSLLMRVLTWLVFGSIPQGMDVFVHPVALAGWVGLFVTALNLFPVGQLDGGRIAYALFGPWHRQVSIATFVALMALGAVFHSANWIVFAGLILLLMGFHHPPPLDDLSPLSRRRYVLGVFCLILLILLIPPVPIS